MMQNDISVLQKLKNRAKSKKIPFQLVLQLFCQEEFLRRLSISPYRDKLILKGGLFIFSYNGFEGRPTMDIDFLAKQITNDHEAMKRAVETIMMQETGNDYIKFTIKSIENIAEQKAYHGVRVKMITTISNTKTPFDIDIGIGDVIIPSENELEIPTQLEGFVHPKILSYSLESTIAEKLEAIFSRMETTSRMKDYYDIFYLAKNQCFDGNLLTEAIKQTFKIRGTVCDYDSLKRISVINLNEDMGKRWQMFTEKTLNMNIEFQEVVELIIKFVEMPIQAIQEDTFLEQNWSEEFGWHI
ncbi:MAG: nucleotidyl transferase AbiEii/AbiGii toxin family protein [Peptostreptococcaceae bacterium]|nr:nucleotidyl transferase AbiEii/AbiGii toxin family protein [Peptostreptococcaceae bacterium]